MRLVGVGVDPGRLHGHQQPLRQGGGLDRLVRLRVGDKQPLGGEAFSLLVVGPPHLRPSQVGAEVNRQQEWRTLSSTRKMKLTTNMT